MKCQQKIEYITPPSEQTELLARQICRGMVKRRGKVWASEETVNDFSQFLRLLIRIQSKSQSNKQLQPEVLS